MKHKLPQGYSKITVNLFGKDIHLASVPNSTLQGISKLLEGLRDRKLIQLKLKSGEVVRGEIRKALNGAFVVQGQNGKVYHARKPVPRAVLISPVRTKVSVSK